MNTTFTFAVSCSESRRTAAERSLDEAHRLVGRLERELSEYLPESPVFKFNGARVGEAVAFSEDGQALWRVASRLAAETNGAFHPLAKSEGGLQEGAVEWDGTRMVKRKAGAWIGFGAIGKGFALDGARAVLEQDGFTNYALSAGGSSQILSGFAAPDEPWRWGWSWQKDADGDDLGFAMEHRTGEPVALGVSGFHEKGRHILDPRTRRPAADWALSTLVAHSSATESDALSTAMMVSGWDGVSDSSAKAIIDLEQTPRWNARFESLWKMPVLALLAFLSFFPWLSAMADDAIELTEQAVDLTSLGVEDFMPYAIERNPIWIALPLLSLFLVALHMMKGPSREGEIKTVEPRREQ